MKSLGIKRETNIFEGPATAKDLPKETFPRVDMPLDFIADKDLKKDEEVTITIKAKVIGYEDTEYRKVVTFELKEGEIEGHDKKKESEPTLLG